MCASTSTSSTWRPTIETFVPQSRIAMNNTSPTDRTTEDDPFFDPRSSMGWTMAAWSPVHHSDNELWRLKYTAQIALNPLSKNKKHYRITLKNCSMRVASSNAFYMYIYIRRFIAWRRLRISSNNAAFFMLCPCMHTAYRKHISTALRFSPTKQSFMALPLVRVNEILFFKK